MPRVIRLRRSVPALVLFMAVLLVPLLQASPVRAQASSASCSTAGTWTPGELNVYWFDVEQGDAQLVVGPDGTTMLIDLGETSWNSTNATRAKDVASRIQAICGVSGPVHLDYVMASHLHLDHIGYAGNPGDSTGYGNGIYELLDPAGLDFTVGELITRDAGHWDDAAGDGDGTCDVGTSASPSPEVVWHNAGTVSQTARRWICWIDGPAGQADRANIEGNVTVLTGSPWPSFDLGSGVAAQVVQSDAQGVMQADGSTPVSGDHSTDSVPPSENDYSTAIRFQYGDYVYATAGDTDGEYSTSSFGYSYNDVEASIADDFGDVATMRVNHHGSGHSSSLDYVDALAPETAVISCGANSYGHPANRVLDALRQVANGNGVGADTFLTNNPCDDESDGAPIDYGGTFNDNGDIWLATSDDGASYDVTYDAGTNSYGSAPTTPPPTATVDDLVLNEYVPDNATYASEFVELYNPTDQDLDAGGLWIDDIADGGKAPQQVTGDATVAAGGYLVVDLDGYVLNNAGDDVRLLAADQATVIDAHTFTTSADDLAWFRAGDGGDWCPDDGEATPGLANPSTCPA